MPFTQAEQLDHARSLRCAVEYRRLGLTPLPTCRHDKKPDMGVLRSSTYKQYRSEPPPEALYTPDRWLTPNLQLLTGQDTPSPLKLLVVDCDGEEAIARWSDLCRLRRYEPPPTWAVRSGSGHGRHIYFRLADETRCPSRLIWGMWDTLAGRDGSGGWVNHKKIEIKADAALVVVPPSIFSTESLRYQFEAGCSPREIAQPAEAPEWLLTMPALATPRFDPVGPAPKPPRPYRAPYQGGWQGERLSFRDVLDGITDKLDLVVGWGLRVQGAIHPEGWITCHVPGRPDRHPSGRFNIRSGYLVDHAENTRYGLFEVGILLGAFHELQESVQWCANHYGLTSQESRNNGITPGPNGHSRPVDRRGSPTQG